MLKAERMARLTLLCKKEDAKTVVNILAHLRAVHITDHQRKTLSGRVIDIGTPFPSAEELSASLVVARNLLSKLTSTQNKRHEIAPPESQSISQRIVLVKEIAQSYAVHEQELQESEKNLQRISTQLDLLDMLAPVKSPVCALYYAKSVENILVRRNKIAKQDDPGSIEQLKPLQVIENPARGALLITVLKEDSQAAKDLLSAEHDILDFSVLKELRDPALRATPLEATAILRQENILAQRQQQHILAMQGSFGCHVDFLAACEPILALELLKAQAPLHFGTTRELMIIEGFLPQRRVRELETQMSQLLVLVDSAPATDAPVALQNPAPANSFEALIHLYSLPKYNEIDPTSIMAITFPVFFGFMLGDIGYGICALAAALALQHYAQRFRQAANIFTLSAIATVIFGIVFGEFFGSENLLGYHLTPLLHRTENVMLLGGIVILVGIIHINLGLLLGMVNEAYRGFWSVMLSKGSWIIMQLGIVLVLASLGMLKTIVPSVVIDPYTAWTVLAIAVCAVWRSHGTGILEHVGNLFEIPMIISNTLSYTRLVAMGLASVYLAMIINEQAGALFMKGGAWLVLGVIILIIGHAINLALGLFGPFLHSLRLHYVEFFTKFYNGGGKPYMPFGIVEVNKT